MSMKGRLWLGFSLTLLSCSATTTDQQYFGVWYNEVCQNQNFNFSLHGALLESRQFVCTKAHPAAQSRSISSLTCCSGLVLFRPCAAAPAASIRSSLSRQSNRLLRCVTPVSMRMPSRPTPRVLGGRCLVQEDQGQRGRDTGFLRLVD